MPYICGLFKKGHPVNFIKQFSIPFVGLKGGKHRFEYVIQKEFFDQFEYSPIKTGNLKVDLDFDKQHESMFILEFSLKGQVELICDRCNEPFLYPIEDQERIIVKLAEEGDADHDEFIILERHASEINIADYLYEFINLAVPIIHVHPDDENGKATCNEEVLKLLKKLSVGEEKEQKEDPRWDILKKLNKN